MKIKALGATIVTTAIWSGALVAQSTTVTEPVAAPAVAPTSTPSTTLSVTPGLSTGSRTDLNGNISGGNTNHVMGAFLTPKLNVDYKNAAFDFNLDYELEMFTGKAFGNSPDKQKSYAKNAYFQNHPVVIAGFKFAPGWVLKTTNDLSYKMGAGNPDNSLIEVASINEIQYKINNTLTVGAGYRLDYVSNYGTDVVPATVAFSNKVKAAVAKGANAANITENPSTIIHAGAARAIIKFNDDYSLNTIVTAGIRRDEGKTAGTRYRYRINNDLTVGAIKNLDLALRYRLQLEDNKGASKGTWLNLGRVIASYALAKHWSVDLQNTFIAVTPRDSKNDKGESLKTVYENENYLGVSYKF